MGKFTLAVAIVVAFEILTPAAHIPLLHLDGCRDDLDRVRRTTSDASDAAEDAESKHDEFENCRKDDELEDRCSNRRSDYESAVSDLETKMDDLDSRLRSVQTSCGYEFTINRMSALEASQRRLETAKRRLCASVKKLIVSGLSPDNALQMCKANMDEQLCKACLGLK